MLLSIIVINYKTADLTKKCVESIYSLLGKKIGDDVEVVIVDNDSGDMEIKKLQSIRDKLGFKLLISKKNLGFAAGCNLGAEMSEGQLLLLLNSDTKVEGGIFEMAHALKKTDRFAILGGKILGEDKSVEKSSGKFYNLWNLFLMLSLGERFGIVRFSPKDFKKVDWVSGGFMMIKKDVFDKLEGFDESYFMYLEDMDLCLRAKKNGYLTYYYPNASVIHKKHASASRQFAIFNIYKSLIIFYKKNENKLRYNIAIALLYSKVLVALFIGKIFGRRAIVQTYEEALRLF